MTIELHFSVAGYGGFHLPFSGIAQYLRGLVFVYERPIIANIDNFRYVWMHKYARLGASGGMLPEESLRNEML